MKLGLNPRRWPAGLRMVGAAVVPPGVVTLGAALPVQVSTTMSALGYVLAVVVSTAVGGVWAGLAASALSFLALNFFFTPPFHTFIVAKAEDLVALAVFLVVSATVGTMLSRVLTQRTRAERREREARLLHHLGTRLLSGVPTDEVLGSLARSVTELFGLDRCEITTELAEGPIVAVGAHGASSGGAGETIPMVARDREIGRIVAVRNGTRPALGPDERSVIQTFANQMALAIDGMRLASEAQEARVEAETNRTRASLFSSVTHDLRTPLASITASVTSLIDEETVLGAENRRELLETIRHEAERLNRLVGNLLDLSRMKAGALTPSKTPTSVEEIIEGVVARLEPMLKDYDLRLSLREDVPEIPLDVMQIDQVLTNLLENAVRFAPRATQITVTAARWRSGVQIRIADQGPGVPQDQRDRVFDPFVRGEGSEGTGLGLAIARAIVDAHGGKIRIGSNPGGGAAVVIHLPGDR